MALVSQALPIPAALAAGAVVAACGEDKPAEAPMGTVSAPDHGPVTDAGTTRSMFPEGAVGTVSAPQKAPTDEPPVGTVSAPEMKVGEMPAPEHKVGKEAAPELPPGKRRAPDAGAKH